MLRKYPFAAGTVEHFFSREDNLRCHMRGLPCPECHEIFCTKYEREIYIEEKHASTSKVKQDSSPSQVREGAFSLGN